MMTFAPPLVLFSNTENTDPTYSKFKSSHQQDSPFPLSTHAERDVLTAALRLKWSIQDCVWEGLTAHLITGSFRFSLARSSKSLSSAFLPALCAARYER